MKIKNYYYNTNTNNSFFICVDKVTISFFFEKPKQLTVLNNRNEITVHYENELNRTFGIRF